MTQRLYYTEAYRTTFDARIEAIEGDGRRVYLDRTAFYPTSGGQPHDLGWLNDLPLVDVIDEGERIAHLLERAGTLQAGQSVSGRIDWARRSDLMQQHTGQHLLSAVLADLFGWTTTSVHFGAESSTVDFDTEGGSAEQLSAAEDRCHQVIAEARPVRVDFEDAARATGLRKPSERTGKIRIITIEGVDRSACGGTHVARTSEIGPLLIRGTERAKRALRVEFVCGDRALRRARADCAMLSAASRLLTVSPDEVPGSIELLQEQLREERSARRRLTEELVGFRARELYAATAADSNGIRRIVVREPSGDPESLRLVGLALSNLPAVWFVGALDQPATIIAAASADSGRDAGRLLREALAAVGGRGGGSPRVAQGTVPDPGTLYQLLEMLQA